MKSSRKLTTIVTLWGAYQYRVSPYGLSAAPPIFQNMLTKLLREIPGIVIFINDILVSEKTKKILQSKVAKILQHLKSKNIELNLFKS